jgi:predicted deacylase
MKSAILAPVLAILATAFLSACTSAPGAGGSCTVSPASVGRSAHGAPLIASTLGSGPLRVYLVGGIHGDESEGQSALADIRRAFASPPLAQLVTLRLLDDMNPDGTAARTRTSSTGVDLNRNWPAANFGSSKGRGSRPLSEPETAAAHADILAFDPHLLVALHSSGNGPYVNFDGPPSARALAEKFVAAAGTLAGRWRVVPDMGYPTPGSMGSYFGRDRGIPILTIELRRGDRAAPALAALSNGLRSLAAGGALARTPLSGVRRSQRAQAAGPAGSAAQ